jgi:hypothetical protein
MSLALSWTLRQIVAIVLPVVAYILGEAYVDAQGVKTKKE